MHVSPIAILFTALGGLSAVFGGVWVATVRALRRTPGASQDPAHDTGFPGAEPAAVGFLTNFLDTLGIGAFATTTALLRLRRLVPDHLIPGTLNVGLTPPAILQSFIFTTILPVVPTTLIVMVISATTGAWFGAGVVAHWPRQTVRTSMGTALVAASGVMTLTLVGLVPAGGEALGLAPGPLALAAACSLVLGALMTLGIGFYAPCMILLSFLGMSPKAIFPIMMTACGFLQPTGSLRFMKERAFHPRVSLGLTLGGLPAVLVAAFLVKQLPLSVLKWVVVAVTCYTGTSMLLAGRRTPQKASEA